MNLDNFTEDPAEVKRVGPLLERYCHFRAIAMKYRIRGNVDMAKTFENLCENIFKQLPEELRWRMELTGGSN